MAIFNKAFEGIGSLISPTAKSKAYITANKTRMAKYGMAPKGSSSKVATRAFEAAVSKRQAQVGRRAVGTTAALGSVGMYRNQSGSRGGYNAPNMQAPRGSGRFA